MLKICTYLIFIFIFLISVVNSEFVCNRYNVNPCPIGNPIQYFKPYSLQATNAYSINTTSPQNIFNQNNQGIYICATVYVNSVIGVDNQNGTINYPVQSLPAAQTIWRKLISTLPNQNILVILDETFELNQQDSVSKNNYLIFTSLNSSSPVSIHGGELLSKTWTLHNATLNIWKLYVGSSFNARNIWINNTRIPKARTITIPGQDSTTNLVSPIVNVSNYGLPPLTQNTTAEVVILGYFQSWRCQSTITPQHIINISYPCWQNMGLIDFRQWLHISWIENSLSLLTTPGSWVHPLNDNYIYYIPLSTQPNINSLDIISPTLTQIMYLNNVNNIAFFNITFATSNWDQASSENGYSCLQSDYLWNTSISAVQYQQFNYTLPFNVFTNYMYTNKLGLFVPSSIYCYYCKNTVIAFSTLQNMGNSALFYGPGSQNNLFWMNTISDISGSGLRIGTLLTTDNTQVSNITIQDNIIHDVANEFFSSVAIFHLWTQNSIINHNTIYNLPYTSISSGLGWGGEGTYPLPQNANNQITYNNIYNFSKYMNDGAGIYLNGEATGSTLSANYLHDSFVTYFNVDATAIYFDQAADNWLLTNDNNINNVGQILHFNFAGTTNTFCCNASNSAQIANSQTVVPIVGVNTGNPTINPFNLTNTMKNHIMQDSGARNATSISTTLPDFFMY